MIRSHLFYLMALTAMFGGAQPLSAAEHIKPKASLTSKRHHESSSRECSSCKKEIAKRLCHLKKKIKKEFKVQCDHVITADDIGHHGFEIKEAGYYCLGENVAYNPKDGNPAIRISAQAGGNVTLDLHGKTLSQKSKDVANIDGIVIDPGLTNVIIKNGTIRDFSDAGIRAGAISATVTIPLITELSISEIRSFNNGLTTTIVDPLGIGDGMGGAVILNAQDTKVNNCDFNENFRAGLWAFNVTKFTMDNCHCDDNLGANSVIPGNLTADGAEVGGISADVAIRNCTFNRNSSGNSAYGFNSGATFGTSVMTNLLIDSCQANDTNVTLSDPAVAAVAAATGGVTIAGIVMVFAENVTITNCEASGTSLTLDVPMTPSFPALGTSCGIYGMNIGFGSANVTVTNCSASGQTFQNNSAVGSRVYNQSFSFFAVDQLYMANCHADGNVNVDPNVPSLLLAEGFDLAAVGNVVIEDCSSCGHKQAATNPPGEFSFAAGFKANIFQPVNFPFFGPVIFRRCVATGNMDTGTSDGLAFGFTTREPQQPGDVNSPFVFDSCIAEENTNSSNTGTGFDLFNLADSKVINCLAESNNIGINVSDFAPGASNGNIISDNVLSANTDFGIQDLSAGMSNAYYSNRAKNNGPTPATTNYSGVIFPTASCPVSCVTQNKTPVLFWSLPNAPCALNTNCVASQPLDNLSIVN